MEKMTTILEKVKTKVDLKTILTLVNAIMGVLRGLIEAKQSEETTI